MYRSIVCQRHSSVWWRRAFSTEHTAERAARRVKNVDSEKNNLYLDAIRDTHDPSMHLKTIEDELQGTIGKALGKQGQKIQYFCRLMQAAYTNYQQQGSNSSDDDDKQRRKAAAAELFNDYRRQAIQARWELMVHRQAAGCIVDNNKYVMEQYPIAQALAVHDDDGDSNTNEKKKKVEPKKFGDQLDWWQTIGRWR
jgi:hypothetical protein